MTEAIKNRLKEMPKSPGVYFHKDSSGEVIYVGKAAVLRNRVGQYFQKSRTRDPKTDALVLEIADTDWIESETEIDALFLEAEMIKRYMPKYNILLRDDKSLSYVRIDIKSDNPTVFFTRRPLDDGAEYFGPYISSWEVKKALRYLRRVFPFATNAQEGTMGSKLYEQLGLDPGVASGKTSLKTYRTSLRQLMRYLRGDRAQLIKELERDMKKFAKAQDFEQAAKLRNQLNSLLSLNRQIIFSDREALDISKDQGLVGLQELLGLSAPPKRIEGYDISHMSGTDNVASMVVFTYGLPDKTEYRKYKMRLKGNNDFAHMAEVISRRLSEKNVSKWPKPDLILIDGGKGQLSSAILSRDLSGWGTIPMIGLAKRLETIIVPGGESGEAFKEISLPSNSHVLKLLQRIRDESHRFAVSYHSTLKRARQHKSWLDEVPGIGPATKKKLIKSFGSSLGVKQASKKSLEDILGPAKASAICEARKLID